MGGCGGGVGGGVFGERWVGGCRRTKRLTASFEERQRERQKRPDAGEGGARESDAGGIRVENEVFPRQKLRTSRMKRGCVGKKMLFSRQILARGRHNQQGATDSRSSERGRSKSVRENVEEINVGAPVPEVGEGTR